jgi:glycerophosphoryl diester phosphodiesterase
MTDERNFVRPDWDTLPPIPASRMSNRKPILVGHRGARGLAPENTIYAFQVADALRIDGVEFDVQRSKDGHLIVFHDETVDRVTNGTGNVFDLTLDEIKALDAGGKFDPTFRDETIPTLRETFDYLWQSDLLLFIELKDPWRFPGMEQQVIDLIRDYDLVERVQIRSFFHLCLHEVYRLAPEIAISELWEDRLPAASEVAFKTLNAFYPLYTPENLAEIHARGQQATAWTVNDLEAARRLIEAGIDGLTTDYPDRMLTLYGA